MQKSFSKGFSGWAQVGILIGLLFAAFILAGIVSVAIWAAMAHGPVVEMQTNMFKPENLKAVLVVQCVSTLIIFFLPVFFFAKICYTNSIGFLGFNGKITGKQLLIVVLLVAASLPLIDTLATLNKMIPLPKHLRASMDAAEKTYNDQVAVMAQIKTWGQYLISLFVIAFLPAVFEETFFRGGVQQLLTRWFRIPWLAILLTSLLFSAIHFSWYGFFARAALGVVLGVVFYYGQSIWLNITLHFLNNGFVVTGMFVMYKQGKPIDMEDGTMPLWAGIIGLVLVIGLIKWFRQVSPPPEPLQSLASAYDHNNPFKKDEQWA